MLEKDPDRFNRVLTKLTQKTEEGIKRDERENQAPENKKRKIMESGEEEDDPMVEDPAPNAEQSGTASSSSDAMTDVGQRNHKRGAELESDQKSMIIGNEGVEGCNRKRRASTDGCQRSPRTNGGLNR